MLFEILTDVLPNRFQHLFPHALESFKFTFIECFAQRSKAINTKFIVQRLCGLGTEFGNRRQLQHSFRRVFRQIPPISCMS